MTTNNHQPGRCTICGCYLTTVQDYAGDRCLDPAHWQAAGLAPRDFYAMARIMATGQAQQSTASSVTPQETILHTP